MNEEWQSVLLRVGDIHFSDVLQPSPSAKMALCSNFTVTVVFLHSALHDGC